MLPLSVYPLVHVLAAVPFSEYIVRLVTLVLVVAVMLTVFFTCTLDAENFTLFSVGAAGAAVTVTVAVLAAVAVPLASKPLKVMVRLPAPLNA